MLFFQVESRNLRLERWVRLRGIVADLIQLCIWAVDTESINWSWAPRVRCLWRSQRQDSIKEIKRHTIDSCSGETEGATGLGYLLSS
jgi:hypothetical protein